MCAHERLGRKTRPYTHGVIRPPRALNPRQWKRRVRHVRRDLHETLENSRRVSTITDQLVEELAHQRQMIESIQSELATCPRILADYRSHLLHALRIVRDDDVGLRQKLLRMRDSESYEEPFETQEPLVSILIPTFDNTELLRDRSIPSVLAQTYQRWECIIVGDGAPDETEKIVELFADGRLHFVNLPYRGPYPDDPRQAHMISGTAPWNAGLAMARGAWIAGNADDDALRPNAVESLVAHAQRCRAEVAYGYIDERWPDRPAQLLGAFPPRWGQWGIQSSLFHRGLKFLTLQPSDWVFEIPNDMSLMERMLRIGVRFSMLEEIVVEYYPSVLWRADRRSQV